MSWVFSAGCKTKEMLWGEEGRVRHPVLTERVRRDMLDLGAQTCCRDSSMEEHCVVCAGRGESGVTEPCGATGQQNGAVRCREPGLRLLLE